MARIFRFVGLSLGSWAGWWLGAHIGLMTAVFVSAIGAGVGLYIAQRIWRDYLS